MSKNESKGVWFACLYRFGYSLEVAGESEKEVVDLLMKEYVRAYKDWNDGADPRKEETPYGDTYYNNAKEDIEVHFATFGKVEWR